MAKETSQKLPEGFEPPKYLASLIAAINEGAKAAQAGMFLFLLVGLYLLATAFSSSDEDLLLGKAVTISQIGASLAVNFSFAIAPAVFLFLHIYALTRYDMLATNVRHFMVELRATVTRGRDQERCRQLLANIEFVQMMTAPTGSALRSGLWPVLLVGTLVVFPVLVLLLVQINSLRYQDMLLNNVQRLWLLIDLLAVAAFLFRNPLRQRAAGQVSWLAFTWRWNRLLWLPVVVFGLDLVWLNVAPAEADRDIVRHDQTLPSWSQALAQPFDTLTCPQLKWGCRYLRVEHRTLVDHVWNNQSMGVLRGDDGDHETYAKAVAEVEGVVLRGRNLRFAVLDDSRLYAADLVGVDLTNASLVPRVAHIAG